jgi:hypothetical protein
MAVEISLRNRVDGNTPYEFSESGPPPPMIRQNWKLVEQGGGLPDYYWNKVTGETRYDLPEELFGDDGGGSSARMHLPGMADAAVENEQSIEDPASAWVKIAATDSLPAYYWNAVTNESTYETPEHFVETEVATENPDDNPLNWSEGSDSATGATYYYNSATGLSQWVKPACLVLSDSEGREGNNSTGVSDANQTTEEEEQHVQTAAHSNPEAETQGAGDGEIGTEQDSAPSVASERRVPPPPPPPPNRVSPEKDTDIAFDAAKSPSEASQSDSVVPPPPAVHLAAADDSGGDIIEESAQTSTRPPPPPPPRAVSLPVNFRGMGQGVSEEPSPRIPKSVRRSILMGGGIRVLPMSRGARLSYTDEEGNESMISIPSPQESTEAAAEIEGAGDTNDSSFSAGEQQQQSASVDNSRVPPPPPPPPAPPLPSSVDAAEAAPAAVVAPEVESPTDSGKVDEEGGGAAAESSSDGSASQDEGDDEGGSGQDDGRIEAAAGAMAAISVSEASSAPKVDDSLSKADSSGAVSPGDVPSALKGAPLEAKHSADEPPAVSSPGSDFVNPAFSGLSESVPHEAMTTEQLVAMARGSSMEQYGEKYFLLERKGKGRITAGALLQWESNLIKQPLRILPKHLEDASLQMFKNIMSFMGDRKSSKAADKHAEKILSMVMDATPDIRDEFYCQLCKQLKNNPGSKSVLHGWQLMTLCLSIFPPSTQLQLPMMSFCASNLSQAGDVSLHAEGCLHSIPKICRTGARSDMSAPELTALWKSTTKY